jgi:hypothetical protein
MLTHTFIRPLGALERQLVDDAALDTRTALVWRCSG